MDELLKDFLTETTEHIEGAETQLVQFERDPSDASLIASIFRLVHTIKGTSSFLGLERLEKVAHAAETVMGLIRDGAPPTQHSVTLILAAIDRIKTIIEGIGQAGSEPPGDDSQIISALEAYCQDGGAPRRRQRRTRLPPPRPAPRRLQWRSRMRPRPTRRSPRTRPATMPRPRPPPRNPRRAHSRAPAALSPGPASRRARRRSAYRSTRSSA